MIKFFIMLYPSLSSSNVHCLGKMLSYQAGIAQYLVELTQTDAGHHFDAFRGQATRSYDRPIHECSKLKCKHLDMIPTLSPIACKRMTYSEALS